MKKTLIATSVAMAVSGTAFAMDPPTVGGQIRVGIQQSDGSGPTGDSELDTVSGKLVLTLGGEEDLGNGLVASYGIEFENDSADSESGTFTNDKSWVALTGDMGKFIIGEHSDMGGWACGGTDILNYGDTQTCTLGYNTSPPNSVQYRGGSGDVNFGVILQNDNDGEMSTFVGVQYSTGDLSVGAQFVQVGDAALGGAAAIGPQVDESAYIVGGTYALGDITLALTLGDNGGTDGDGTAIAVHFPLGGGTLAILSESGDGIEDSTDLIYQDRLGASDDAYWGVEFNDEDDAEDTRLTGWIGTNF